MVFGKEAKRCPRCTKFKIKETGYYFSGKAKVMGAYCKQCSCEINALKVDPDVRRRSAIRSYWNNREKKIAYEKMRYHTILKFRERDEKDRARAGVYFAIKRGDLHKPNCCSRCLRKLPSIKIQGHHSDYSKPLVVTWLCRPCHGMEHRKN